MEKIFKTYLTAVIVAGGLYLVAVAFNFTLLKYISAYLALAFIIFTLVGVVYLIWRD